MLHDKNGRQKVLVVHEARWKFSALLWYALQLHPDHALCNVTCDQKCTAFAARGQASAVGVHLCRGDPS